MPRGVILIGLILFTALPLRGQVVLNIAQPVLDSFPIVDVGVNMTDNGGPATLLNTSNFSVREDGIPATILSLKNCSGTSNAAIALIIDTSQSMNGSLGSGPIANRTYGMFNNAVSQFIASIPGTSQLALIPFADTSSYWYPRGPNFYASNSTADTTSLMAHVSSLRYVGAHTVVDYGIAEAAQALSISTLPRRIMVLITDDVVDGADSVQQYLNSVGIQLYILEVARDSIHTNYANHDLAIGTGGSYFAAYDTTLYAPMLLDISHLIFAEHCTLEYRSNLLCPSWNTHQVQITLKYKGTTTDTITSYSLGRISHDSLPPRLVLDTPGMFIRVLHAYDYSKCSGNLQSFIDSSFSNFIVHAPNFNSDSASDSLTVIDTLYPADAYFVATDSAGNISRIHIHYQPRPDTHPPQFSVPVRLGANYSETIEEMLPWDRGIDSIYLASGSKNLSLDSIRFAGKQLANAFLHIMNLNDSASGCLVARDSVGNANSICIEWNGENGDTLPPLFMQNPIAEPRLSLSGIVTEERLHDRGIRQIMLTPISNTATPQIIYDSAHQARVAVILMDSMYPAHALVEAFDSAGNGMRYSLRYEPVPDIIAPIITNTSPTKSTFIFYATDTQAWDRGIASLALLPSSINASSGAITFIGGHRASLSVTITDQTQNATMVVEAIDSAGNQVTATVPFTGISLIPFGDSVIDFGMVIAPATATRSIILTNQNDIPVTLDMLPLQCDASEFSVVTATPLVFSALGSQSVTVEFHPSLIGTYKASTSLQQNVPFGSISLLGHSIGAIRLALDSAITKAGEAGELHLSVDVEPKPANLDTIGFTLTYDPNVLSFGNFPSCPNGSTDTGLCNYNVFWSGGTEGNRQAMLVRTDTSKVSTLSFGSSVLTLPFQTYVSVRDTTPIHIQPLNTYSATVISTQDGLVLPGDTCGTGILRSAMTNEPPFRIISIVPNPAQTSLAISVESGTESNAEIHIVSLSGATQQILPYHFLSGKQSIVLPNLPKTSGTYEIVIQANGVDVARQSIEVVH